MTQDEFNLRRAIRLAMNGRGLVEPNPMVGCVIVKNDRIIGEGFHQQYGYPHAEPNALASCIESPEGATAYVTLEPCCHTDKQTPPCVPRLIAAKISRVVIGCLDPNSAVNGNGVRQLREAGIAVDGPMLEAECKQLIAPFIARQIRQRCYVTLKWAQSADGKVAGAGGRRMQIGNSESARLVHLLRSRSDAICVGVNTVLTDNPSLTVRDVPMLRPCRRIVIDSRLRIPLESALVQTARQTPTVVYCSLLEHKQPDKAAALRELGVEVMDFALVKPFGEGGHGDRLLNFSTVYLSERGTHLLVEPGATLAKAVLPRADRLWVIRSPKIIGDETAPSAAAIPDYFVPTGEVDLAGDRLCEYLNTKSPVFFATVQSADFSSIGLRRAQSSRVPPMGKRL